MDGTDEDLMLRYRDGDAAAFDELFERYRRPLYSYVLRLMQAQVWADDVFQDTWLSIHRSRGKYTRRSKFSSWVFRVATHRCYNRLARAEMRHVHQSLQAPAVDGSAEPLEICIGGTEPDAAFAAQMTEQQRMIEEAVARLPVDYRSAFVLHFSNGLSHAEIAAISGVAEATCRTRVHRACRELRKMLEGSIDLPGMAR